MSNESVPVDLVGVRIELPSNTPIVLLREKGGDRYLPIWIGAGEATAIALALEGVEPQRPLTHDLLATIVGHLGSSVGRVVITQLTAPAAPASLNTAFDGAMVRTGAADPATAASVEGGSPPFRVTDDSLYSFHW